MAINYHKHRQAIETLYTDIATIFRYQNDRDPDTGVTKKVPVPIHENKPCRLSQKSLGVNSQTDAQNNIAYETKLFIAPELDILQGDLIKSTRGKFVNGSWVPISPERKYEAGEPFPYPTHQEVSLQRREWA